MTNLKITPLAGDASTRRYYRLLIDNKQSMALMEMGPDSRQRGQLFCRQRELFSHAGLPVPRVYRYVPETGLMFLEDCGDVTLEGLVAERGAENCYNYYRQAVEWILQLQAATDRLYGNHPAYSLSFDAPNFMYELDFFVTHMLEGFLKREVNTHARYQLDKYFNRLSGVLAQERRYLTHRDYHSRNLMVRGESLKILDFQDARLGLCQYDLASLLRDSYAKLPEDMVGELLDYYLCGRERWKLPQVDKNGFNRTFTFTSIQRSLKALGTFGYQADKRRNKTYLPYISPTLEYLRINLYRYPDFTGLGDLLGEYIPELTK